MRWLGGIDLQIWFRRDAPTSSVHPVIQILRSFLVHCIGKIINIGLACGGVPKGTHQGIVVLTTVINALLLKDFLQIVSDRFTAVHVAI